MTSHKIGAREEWLAARLELLEAEKALTRRSDELARWRQELPWVRIDKEYRSETDEGPASLTDLFAGTWATLSASVVSVLRPPPVVSSRARTDSVAGTSTTCSRPAPHRPARRRPRRPDDHLAVAVRTPR
ncbi:hypothetical protein GCM10029978_065870 [Actinoallomurus acanthiterrae]